MLLITAHLEEHKVRYPSDAVMRINLAWISSINELGQVLDKIDNNVFLDHPIGRLKPPAHSYTFDELKPIVDKYENIRYIAVSNVESANQLLPYQEAFPRLIITPKIETVDGVTNLKDIIDALDASKERVVMIDHDDLLQSLSKNAIPLARLYDDFVEPATKICKKAGVIVLRTKGVVFSD